MLDIIEHGPILELRMNRPPVNALNKALLDELTSALERAANDGFSGVLLSGGEKVFSGGLDVPELMSLDRRDLEASWRAFFRTCSAIACCPVPVAAAIGGHSPAGGAVLALYCDYRVMVMRPPEDKPALIGLNETQVGLMIPESIQFAMRRAIGPRHAERLMVSGAMIDSSEAARLGLVDELAPAGEVVAAALRWLEGMAQLPQVAMRATRSIARSDLMNALGDPDRFDLNPFLAGWYNEETQTVLNGLVARLKGG